jgi:hypothetical protein
MLTCWVVEPCNTESDRVKDKLERINFKLHTNHKFIWIENYDMYNNSRHDTIHPIHCLSNLFLWFTSLYLWIVSNHTICIVNCMILSILLEIVLTIHFFFKKKIYICSVLHQVFPLPLRILVHYYEIILTYQLQIQK